MKTRFFSVAVIVVVMFSMVGCASNEALSVAWTPTEQESFTYDVYSVETDAVIGSAEFGVERCKWNNKDVVAFISDQTIPALEQTSRVITEKDSLKPLFSELDVTMQGQHFNIKATYGDEEISYDVVTPDGTQQDTFKYEMPIYDNQQALQFARFLPLEEGYQQAFRIVNTGNSKSMDAKYVVAGIEEIEVSGQAYECYHVEFRIVGATQHMWYTTSSDHVLVKYDNGATVFLLTNK